jgi:uncharacterized protein (TIRG00374 family)
MRKFLLALLLMLGVYFFISRFTEAQQILDTLRRGDWRWLAAAAGLQLMWSLNVGASFRAIYHAMGMEERTGHMVPLAAAAFFVNVIAPMAGVSGIAIFIADAQKRNRPIGRVSTAAALLVLFDYAAFLVVLTLGLIVLFRRNQLATGEIVASLILVAIALGMASLVYLGMRSEEQLGKALASLGGLVNRVLRPFIHRDYLSLTRAHEFAHDASEGLQEARQSPENLLLPAALALSSKALLISVLFFVFMAFQQPFTVGTLIAGWSIAYLFLIVTPTPSGIGFVEGVLTLTLASMRVPLAAAALITLAYRGITLWFPLAYGAIAIRYVSRATAPARGQPAAKA